LLRELSVSGSDEKVQTVCTFHLADFAKGSQSEPTFEPTMHAPARATSAQLLHLLNWKPAFDSLYTT